MNMAVFPYDTNVATSSRLIHTGIEQIIYKCLRKVGDLKANGYAFINSSLFVTE
jgi:hypothetical protein